MTLAIRVAYGDRFYDHDGRMSRGRVLGALHNFDHAFRTAYSSDASTPSAVPNKKAREWRNGWAELGQLLTAADEQAAKLRSMLPREEDDWMCGDYQEIRRGVPMYPPVIRGVVLNTVSEMIQRARSNVAATLRVIPVPPVGTTGKIKPLKLAGYARASAALAPIRSGKVQRWGARNHRLGIFANVGDRVSDREIARAMLEPASGCGRVAKHYLKSAGEVISLEDAARELAKHLKSALGPREMR